MKMEDKGLEESGRRWKAKKSLEDVYACGGENWEKSKKEKKTYFIVKIHYFNEENKKINDELLNSIEKIYYCDRIPMRMREKGDPLFYSTTQRL